jgi:DUF971 family protein
VSAVAVLPERVTDHAASGVLEIGWPDGRVARLPHALLRAACRCAACENMRRHERREPPIAPMLRLTDIVPVADIGLNLRFTDDHGRGIYPWAYLRELAARAEAAEPVTLG